jgi:hypothetical protein
VGCCPSILHLLIQGRLAIRRHQKVQSIQENQLVLVDRH